MDKTNNNNGNHPNWSRWENHVLSELKRLNGNIEKALVGHEDLTKKYFQLKEDLSIVRARIAMFASIFGLVGSAVLPLLQWVVDKLPR